MVNSVVKEPITPDPTSSPIGSDINDIKMDTFIGVNIKKADPALKKAHINVHVYNAIVLLTGEVPTKELRALAGEVRPAPTQASGRFTMNCKYAVTHRLSRALMML